MAFVIANRLNGTASTYGITLRNSEAFNYNYVSSPLPSRRWPTNRTIGGKSILPILLGEPDAKTPHDRLIAINNRIGERPKNDE